MSLEQALIDNTAALKVVAELLNNLKLASAPVEATPAPAKRTKTAKAAVESSDGQDPKGTRYYHIAEHNSVYKQLPGMPDCSIGSALLVTKEEYEIQRELLQQKFASAAAVVQPEPTPAPVVVEPVVEAAPAPAKPMLTVIEGTQPDEQVSFAEVVAEIKTLFNAHGNSEVAKLLKKYGVNRVPELVTLESDYHRIIAEARMLFHVANEVSA